MYHLCFMGLIVIGLVACGGSDSGVAINENGHSELESRPLHIMTTIPIIENWVAEIAGADVIVRSIIPYEVNPHSYQLGAKDIAEITEASVVFAIGLEYEANSLKRLLESHPEVRVVPLGQFIDPIKTQQNENQNDHAIHIYDPHFWFDPIRVTVAVQVIADELSVLNPQGSEVYKKRASAYSARMKELDNYIQELVMEIPEGNRTLITSHESLRYLGARYDLNVVRAVIPSLNSDKGIGPGHLVDAIQLIRKHDVRVIFLEDETSDRAAQVVAAETGVDVVAGLRVETLIDPTETYTDFIEHNIKLIVETLKGDD